MTAQIPDKFLYEGKQYYYIKASSEFGFNPQEYDVKPMSFITSCWRGFYCYYMIDNNKLYMDSLTISGSSRKFADSFGKYRAGRNDYGTIYKHIMLEMNYSGEILLGRNFIDEYYLHGGIQCASAYQEVLELQFLNGRVAKVVDVSSYVERHRDELFRIEIYGPDDRTKGIWNSIKTLLRVVGKKYWWE